MIKKLIETVKEKNEIDQTQEWYKWSQTYFEWLKDEIIEVEQEIKENNQVYLEDELWDILWNYLNLLEWLKNEWKIESIEKVVKRAESKYINRIDAIKYKEDSERSMSWKEVKEKQKEELKREHLERYGE
jgi:NTP pyrophosphatase (non-canonical NTP hydrolase)